jgi:hypothetical protein
VSGCSQAHNALGTTSGPCFRAIPVAEQMVHHRGALIGVRRGGAERLRRGVLTAGRGRRVCLVAFRGQFGPANVQSPVSRAEGPYAVAVVSLPGNRPLRTVVTSRPVRFRHL